MCNINNSIDEIDFNKYSSSTIYSSSSTDGTVGVWSDGIPVQTVETNPNDIIMCQISDDISLDDYKILYQELKKIFPNNNILLVNSNVIKNITIFKPKEEETSFLDKTEGQLNFNDFLY